jgi:integrase
VAPHKLTLGAWLDTWLWEYKQPTLRPLSLTKYEMVIRRHLKPTLGHIPWQDLRPDQMQRFYNEPAQHGLEATTTRFQHITLAQALTLAEKHHLVLRNVARLVEPPRAPRKEHRTLTMDEVTTKLLPALQGHRLYAAFLALFMLGLRRGKVLGVRWQISTGRSGGCTSGRPWCG